MEDIDTSDRTAVQYRDEDEELLHNHVIQGDHVLLYLDTYLREMMHP